MPDERQSQGDRLRNVNSIRFSWHERLIADPALHKGAGPLAFAGLMLHRFNADLGYAQLGLDYAVVRLNMPKSTVRRGRDLLILRGWIIPTAPLLTRRPRAGTPPRCFRIGGGPDDLLFP